MQFRVRTFITFILTLGMLQIAQSSSQVPSDKKKIDRLRMIRGAAVTGNYMVESQMGRHQKTAAGLGLSGTNATQFAKAQASVSPKMSAATERANLIKLRERLKRQVPEGKTKEEVFGANVSLGRAANLVNRAQSRSERQKTYPVADAGTSQSAKYAARKIPNESLNERDSKKSFLSTQTFQQSNPFSVQPKVRSSSVQTSASLNLSSVGETYVSASYTFWYYEYEDNMDQIVHTIYGPTNADSISVEFSFIDMESNFDYIEVYDEFGSFCDQFTGHFSSYTRTVNCPGNTVDIVVRTDGSVSGSTYDGFSISGYYYTVTTSSNSPPVAVASADSYQIYEGETVYFSGTSSYDPDDSDIYLSYEWDFGDGYFAYSENPTHTYNSPGYYQVRLSVWDLDGGYDEDYIYIDVYVLPSPTANISYTPSNGLVERNTNFSVRASAASSSESTNYIIIDWDDGTPATQTSFWETTHNHSYSFNGFNFVITTVYNAKNESRSEGFLVEVMDAPDITGFSPATGNVGTVVTINGSGFQNVTSVTFNGVAASNPTIVSDSQIRATVPTGASSGPIRVSNAVGSDSSNTDFYLPPSLTGVSPNASYVGTGVTLSGQNLRGTSQVLVGGSTTRYSVNSNASITVEVPSIAVGPTTINITAPAGNASIPFEVIAVPAPVILGISPDRGPVGTRVTITGNHFVQPVQVFFSGTQSSSVLFQSINSVTAEVPAGTTTGPVTVTTSAGTVNGPTFTKTNVTPTITSVNAPVRSKKGKVYGGTVATITGTGFMDGGVSDVVKVELVGGTRKKIITPNRVSLTYTVISNTQIQVNIPQGIYYSLGVKKKIRKKGGRFVVTNSFASSNAWGPLFFSKKTYVPPAASTASSLLTQGLDAGRSLIEDVFEADE